MAHLVNRFVRDILWTIAERGGDRRFANRRRRGVYDTHFHILPEISVQRRCRPYPQDRYVFPDRGIARIDTVGHDKGSDDLRDHRRLDRCSRFYSDIAKDMGASEDRAADALWDECGKAYPDAFLAQCIQYRDRTAFYRYDLY